MRHAIPLVTFALLIGSSPVLSADYVAMSGKELYTRFCGACHGTQGKGDGPVAASLTVEVPDLTLIARRSGGSFPHDRVARIIDGRHIVGTHGSRTMPVWGEDLGRLEIGNPDVERATRTALDRLADYLRELQRPAVR